jgi:hypothetical protein
MKPATRQIFFVLIFFVHFACNIKKDQLPLTGTWELISSTATERDSTYSTFNARLKMIKIINASHFAFLSHAVNNAKDSSTLAFTAGGGAYTLADSIYIEHLDYYIDRQWENNTFQFVVKITGDTLIQKGIEKVEKLGVDRVIVEKYKRITK